jgi:hypothetical protein
MQIRSVLVLSAVILGLGTAQGSAWAAAQVAGGAPQVEAQGFAEEFAAVSGAGGKPIRRANANPWLPRAMRARITARAV